MKFTDLLHKFQGLLQKEKPKLPDEFVQDLIRSLEHTQDEECTCEEVYAIVDQYAEMEFSGKDAARLMPLLKQHIESCHNCCEEYEALLDVLEKSNST
jgi:hypothetical protein